MDFLTVKEVAELRGCSERYIKKIILDGSLRADISLNDKNRKKYIVPVDALDASLQKRYYKAKKANQTIMLPPPKEDKPQKRYEEYTAEERHEIKIWTEIIEQWIKYRSQFNKKTDVDPLFISKMKLEMPGLDISIDILYRKYKAYKEGNIDGLVDKRGGHNKGKTSIPKEVWDWFLYSYLDQRQLPLSQCYEKAKYFAMEFAPELVPVIPSEATFRRQVDRIADAVVVLGREGQKAFDDRFAPYIVRLYDELHANDYWVADNHTFDIITMREDGSETTHRLSLTGMIDARSGVIVGWNLTDNPCSQSTVLAMRHAILRFGIPKKMYFDNGSEFLTHDLAGRGHRTRKSNDLISEPPPIFARLGIELTNAIVKNAKAKPIERTFGALKGCISRLFETFCGGNVLERPESLKYTLKKGDIPTDGRLRELVADFIDGIYNVGAYGGTVTTDKGKGRIDVWNESIQDVGIRKASADDLNLLLMRTSRPQKVGRNGVYITICGERLEYRSDNYWEIQGKEVYVRYDPANLMSVRLYEADTDKYIDTWQVNTETTVLFDDVNENISIGQEKIRSIKKAVKGKLNEYVTQLPASKRIDMLDLSVRQANIGKEGFVIKEPKLIIPVMANEAPLQQAVGTDYKGIIIDMNKMSNNALKRKK